MVVRIMVLSMVVTNTLSAAELHVAVNGSDANPGTPEAPLKTIQRGADLAQPGDTVTVHEGIYREWVNPPRGGTSEQRRITYQAAKGETVVITGSEPAKGWEKVSGDTWKVVIPNSRFGTFNPYVEKVDGDWFFNRGRNHRRGCVYLKDTALGEAQKLEAVLKPAGTNKPLWYAKADNVHDELPDSLMSVAWFKTGAGVVVPAVSAVKRKGTQDVPCAEDGPCVGTIVNRNFLRFKDVDFGDGTEVVELRAAAAAGAGGLVELRLDSIEGELLGSYEVPSTGGEQAWKTFRIPVKKTAGKKLFTLLFKQRPTVQYRPEAWGPNTTIWAQFPGVNPNEAAVEISMRPTVFTPSKTNMNYITLRGFTLRNAATTWVGPCSGQIGLVSAYWCKGWIIEANEIYNSRCSGIALGKYSDEWDGKRGTKEGYDLTIEDAFRKGGWTKERIGSHLVRNNRIHHCGQTGIVGSMGCAFSTITGNEIHDINLGNTFEGAEMAGIKFHGAIDVTISGNHIYRCGDVAGVWLDWMGQGVQLTDNFMHDNDADCGDLFLEVQHGPILVANNLFLSDREMYLNCKGIAFVHNLLAAPLAHEAFDTRKTPFHKPHSTEIAGLREGDNGDHRFYNNILLAPLGLKDTDNAKLPCFASGNVFLKGAQPSTFDAKPLLKPAYDCALKVTQKPDGWYVAVSLEQAWRDEVQRNLVTTELLGKAVATGLEYVRPDGASLRLDTDYLNRKRDGKNPFPGPLEINESGPQKIKVWPRD